MKKILMISGAALIAASAMAVAPAKQQAVEALKGAKIQRMDMAGKFIGSKAAASVEALKRSKLSILGQTLGAETTADEATEDEPAAALSARYYYPPMHTFYTSITPDGIFFPAINQTTQTYLSYGLSGNKGIIPFLNLSTGAQAYEWAYDFMGPEDQEWIPMTAETEHLPLVIEGPYQMVSAPTLTAFAGDEQQSYSPQYVSRFLSGPDLASFGYFPSNLFSDWEEAESEYDYWGVTTCPVNILNGGNIYTYEFAVDRNPAPEDADYYNETGCCMQYVKLLNDAYSKTYDISNVRMSAYIATLPEQSQAYLLDQTWFIPFYASTNDVTLNVTVYPLTAEGQILLSQPYGAGEVVLPAHATADSELALVNLEAVDEEGFPTSNPLVIDGDAVMFITGFNDPAITYFNMCFNFGTTFDDPKANVSDYYACNSAFLVEFDAKEKGVEDAETLSGSRILNTDIFIYGEKAPFWGATDFSINYNVFFPYVLNNEGGTDMSVVAPVEGGDIEYTFEACFLISDLIEEGVMTAECDADWFTFEPTLGIVEINGNEYGINQININAQALPEGVEGRQGVVKFRGFACDFDLVVSQGDVAGISNVAAAANGPVEFFDLQGRKLNAAPANGIYLQRQGNKTIKKIAK